MGRFISQKLGRAVNSRVNTALSAKVNDRCLGILIENDKDSKCILTLIILLVTCASLLLRFAADFKAVAAATESQPNA